MRKELRDYQKEAIQATKLSFEKKIYRGIIHFATGLGKTITAIELTRECFPPDKERTVFIAPSIDLIDQGKRNFIDQWGELRVSNAN